jgi:hypothetical protein
MHLKKSPTFSKGSLDCLSLGVILKNKTRNSRYLAVSITGVEGVSANIESQFEFIVSAYGHQASV